MLRIARIDTPGLLHHVMIRGIERRNRQREAKGSASARDLLCYWSVVELGMSMVDLARKFEITPVAVSYAVQREEKLAKAMNYQLQT